MNAVKRPLSVECRIKEWQGIVVEELNTASSMYGGFHSPHEGFSVMQDQMEDLFDAVRLKPANPERTTRMRKEAVSVAAMALRFLVDLCEVP